MDAATSPTTDTSHPNCQQLGDEIGRLCSYIYAAEHRLLTLIRRFDEHKGWERAGFPSCAHWLSFRCGMDGNTARERVRVAHALKKLPKVDAEFERGALSYSKVRAITRVADEHNENYLLMIAKHGTAHHVEQLVRKYRSTKKLQDPEAVRAVHEDRELTYYYDADGALVIKGRFPAEQGALIIKALEMAMETQHRHCERSEAISGVHPKGTSSADQVPSGQTQPPERPPVAARRADALAEVAETYMNSEPVPNATADRYQVVVHVHSGAGVSADQVPSGQTPHLENGPGVSAETSRRIACDCSLLRVEDDDNGEPLSIGRKTRSIPPAIRRALRQRDSGCRFPGCTNDRFVDGHHIRHWADEGETSLDNLVLLCRHHHHLVHEGGFACEKTEAGEVVFRDTLGRQLPERAPLPTIHDDEINHWLDREFFEHGIDSDTCRTHWYAGERIDWNLAVGNLFLAGGPDPADEYPEGSLSAETVRFG